jgi:hypothetical protein
MDAQREDGQVNEMTHATAETPSPMSVSAFAGIQVGVH